MGKKIEEEDTHFSFQFANFIIALIPVFDKDRQITYEEIESPLRQPVKDTGTRGAFFTIGINLNLERSQSRKLIPHHAIHSTSNVAEHTG